MPKGFARKHDLLPLARRLRSEGLYLREIAEQLGVSLSAVSDWFADPDGAKANRRRASYSTPCVDCGNPTDGSGGFAKHPTRCKLCAPKYEHEQAVARLIEIIQAWADMHGGIPPAAYDWNFAAARAIGHHDRARKAEEGGWPSVNAVQQIFGSWNAGIEAAGFEPVLPGHYGRPGEDPEFCQEIRTQYEQGRSSISLAREHGCTSESILYRIRKAGGTPRTNAEAQALRRAA